MILGELGIDLAPRCGLGIPGWLSKADHGLGIEYGLSSHRAASGSELQNDRVVSLFCTKLQKTQRPSCSPMLPQLWSKTGRSVKAVAADNDAQVVVAAQ